MTKRERPLQIANIFFLSTKYNNLRRLLKAYLFDKGCDAYSSGIFVSGRRVWTVNLLIYLLPYLLTERKLDNLQSPLVSGNCSWAEQMSRGAVEMSRRAFSSNSLMPFWSRFSQISYENISCIIRLAGSAKELSQYPVYLQSNFQTNARDRPTQYTCFAALSAAGIDHNLCRVSRLLLLSRCDARKSLVRGRIIV